MRLPSSIATAAFLAAVASGAYGADISVIADDPAALSKAVTSAQPGDRLMLQPGVYRGPVRVSKPLIIEGGHGVKLLGSGQGTVLTLDAAGITVRALEISGSGRDLSAMDSGVFATEGATGAVIENNFIRDNLYGVYLHGSKDAVAKENRIEGTRTDRLSESGNGVTVWNAPGAKVIGNDIRYGRDGIATNASKRNVFADNTFRNLRFAIHYMYTNDSEIRGNRSFGNAVGFAIMFSSRLKILDNVSDGDRDHGLLLNFANSSRITGNTVRGRLQPASRWTAAGTRGSEDGMLPADAASAEETTGERIGPEKCVFIYNANKNRLLRNEFNGCEIGIHFTAGSEGNVISENSFINNRNQVKYAGTRYVDWSANGRGNYWSDNQAFDLNGDGVGDNVYRPNDIMDKVLWTAPQAKILTSSPAVQVIRWAQEQFPAILPGGVADKFPLMTPPTQEISRD